MEIRLTAASIELFSSKATRERHRRRKTETMFSPPFPPLTAAQWLVHYRHHSTFVLKMSVCQSPPNQTTDLSRHCEQLILTIVRNNLKLSSSEVNSSSSEVNLSLSVDNSSLW